MLTALHVLLTGCHSSFRKRHGVSGFADADVLSERPNMQDCLQNTEAILSLDLERDQ